MMIFFRFLLFLLLINTLSSHDPWILPRTSSFHHVLELIQARARNPPSSSNLPLTLPSLLPLTINNTVCRKDLLLLMKATVKKEKWALKILDSWGIKPPAGLLEGAHLWFGSYDECLHPLYLPMNQTHVSQPYPTKYCTLSNQNNDNNTIFPTKPALIIGICLPQSCHSNNFQSKFIFSIALFSRYLFSYFLFDRSLYIQCPSERREFSTGSIFTLSLILLLSLFVCFAIFIPRFHDYSAITTLKKLFSINQTHQMYSFLNGIRVLTLFWIIFGHSFVFQLALFDNIIHVLDNFYNSFAMQLIYGATFGVDTFFFISGFLAVVAVLNTFQKQEPSEKFRIQHLFLYYFHRYCRLIPTLIFILLISIYLTPWMGYGPIYPREYGFELPVCRQQWWINLLLLNNFIQPQQTCLPVTWYIANDFQFHLLAPILLLPFLFNRRRLTYLLICLLLLANIITIMTVISMNPGTETGMSNDGIISIDYFEKIYIKPWCRIGPFLIGMLTKLLLEYYHSTISTIRIIFYTILSICVPFFCIYFPFYSRLLPKIFLILFQSFSRQCWAFAIGWLVFACSTNQAGLINRILSWSFWTIIARLSYAAYLIHTMVILTQTYNRYSTIHYQTSLLFNTFIAQCFFTLMISIFVVIVIESPCTILERHIRKYHQKKKEILVHQQSYGTINS